MSGLNPFRPKRPESADYPPLPKSGQDVGRPSRAYHNPSPSPISTHSYFPAPPSTATSVTDSSSTPHGYPGTPPEPHTSDADDSQSSDDQSRSDPFHRQVDTSDNDMEEEETVNDGVWDPPGPPHLPRSVPADDRRPLTSVSTAPHSAPVPPDLSNPAFSAVVTPPAPQYAGTDSENYPLESENEKDAGITMVTRPGAPVSLSFPRQVSTAGRSTTVVPQHTTATGMTSQPALGTPSSEAGIDSRALAVRSGNRERKPPPPPRSHHGKLINPSPQATPSHSQPKPRLANRFSYHGTPSETSLFLTPDTPPSRPSQPRIDYFTTLDSSQSTQSTESLRRSQSQHKRPPTPPLSRRHSQMRRSKSTMSRANPARLSMPVGGIEIHASPPPSPGPWTTASSCPREPRMAPPRSDEVGSGSGPGELTLSKRSSQVNPLPPPPPPRRTRVPSSHSNSIGQTTSLEPEKRVEQGDFIPHPSNANDILADLSRLQKEVDDLRDHYESRKASR